MGVSLFLPLYIHTMQRDEQGRAYLEYNVQIGGEPFAYSEGAPYVEDIAELYRDCIRQGKTWQELLGVVGYRFDEIHDFKLYDKR